MFGPKIKIVDWIEAANVIEDSCLLVNSTSLGMQGKPKLRIPLDGLQVDTIVTDLVYAPLETALLRTARHIGCCTVDGLGMLIHQAVPGFQHWFGDKPEINAHTREILLA